MIFWLFIAAVPLSMVGYVLYKALQERFAHQWAGFSPVWFFGIGGITFVVVGIIFAILVGIMTTNTNIPVSQWRVIQHSNLAALGTATTESGRSYFLGEGYVDGEQSISFIIKNSDGSFSTESSSGYPDRVFQSNPDKPYMQVERPYTTLAWLMPFEFESPYLDDYEFFVPKGTIQSNYNINLNK